jgi:hypothetical protein
MELAASEVRLDNRTNAQMNGWFSGYGQLISVFERELGLPSAKQIKLYNIR